MSKNFLSFLFLISLPLILSQDFSFFYQNDKDILEFSTYDETASFSLKVKNREILPNFSDTSTPPSINTFSYFPSDILTPSNKISSYKSKQINGTFSIEYFEIKINDSPYTLIKAFFDTYKGERITEIIIDSFTEENAKEKRIFPKKYENDFIIRQNRLVSKDAYERRNSKIYETFGFEFISPNKSNEGGFFDYRLEKIILVNYRKKKLNYLANLSADIYENKDKDQNEYYDNYNNENNYDEEENEKIKKRFDFNLENLPENFDLIINLEILDKDGKETGEKIMLVQKGFNYPNYKVEDANPNKNMFIISLCSIGLAMILSLVFSIITIIF